MNEMYVYRAGREFRRIDKRKARAAYNNGLVVLCVPCNLNPNSPWVGFCHIDNKEGETFDNIVNAFEYYNCTCTETGRYTAFYIPSKTIDTFTGGDVTADTINTVETYDYSFVEGCKT